jgi:hypothetical protein
MTEREGCELLRGRFQAAGLAVAERVRFVEGGISVTLDGFDAARRIGYEFLTSEDGDRAEFTPEVVAALDARMARDELFILLVDEDATPELLEHAADGFLAQLRRRGRL